MMHLSGLQSGESHGERDEPTDGGGPTVTSRWYAAYWRKWRIQGLDR